jgi:branched-chain amino acid aminotransferase
MFSSVWGGFSTEPSLWAVPPDDHMVHRGDAVFEALKCVNGRVYCLSQHLDRLVCSAQGLGLTPPPEFSDILGILKQAYRLAGHRDFTIRLTVSRGPGSYSVNPYDSVGGSQLYVVLTKLKRPAPEVYERGVSLRTAPFPARGEYATLKTCDYLHNVLAKKSALDAGADYVVSFDSEGFMTEGATENVAIVTHDRELLVPSFSRILKGVTLLRIMDLGAGMVRDGLLKSVGNRDFTEKEAKAAAAEVFLATTSFNVLGVSRWDGQIISGGQSGPISRELLRRLDSDITGEGPYLTSLE